MTRMDATRATLLRVARTLRRAVVWLFVNLFGRWQWQSPAWLSWIGERGGRSWRYLRGNPVRGAAAVVLVIAAGGAVGWYLTRPVPDYVTYVVNAPGLTEYNDDGISSIKPATIVFSESAAPLKQVQKAVTAGINVEPAIDGTWFWVSDKQLRFTPKIDWPVDGSFAVRLASKGLVADRVLLDKYSFKFRSQPFAARIADSQFYQDPRNPNLRKLVATVKFSQEWPQAEHMDLGLHFFGPGFELAGSGELLGNHVGAVAGGIESFHAPWLKLDIAADGQGEQLRQLLLASPLQKQYGEHMRALSISGAAKVGVQLFLRMRLVSGSTARH